MAVLQLSQPQQNPAMYSFPNPDQTNLNISAESWAALDHLELKFLRGYNIKTAKSYFMIGLRLMIVKCLQRLV